MEIKNRKGSTLILTLIVFTVLMLFGTITMSVMSSENKISLRHQKKAQAYYIARAGAEAVEAAIVDMNEIEIKKLSEKLDIGLVTVDEILMGEGKANVVLIKDGDKLVIESKGAIDKVENKVTKIMMGEQSTGEIKVEYAIFSLGDIKLNNGKIDGDIGTNHSIIINGNPSLNGDAYLMESNDFSAPTWWKNNWIRNHTTKELGQEKSYESIKLPTFPINNSYTNFIQGGSNQTTITTSKDYNIFEINSNTKVYIDTTYGDIILNIKQFNLINGQIILLGNNKLTFYVNEMVIGAGSTINNNGNAKQVNIFHNGSSKLTIAGNVKIAGNLYIDNAELDLGGSGGILGNVYSSGKSISLTGNSDITKGLIYAPNADISFTGSGNAYGAVIGKTVSLTGAGTVIFDPNYIDTSLIGSNSDSKLDFKPGYFK